MKTRCLRKGRNMSRMSFDPREAENGDEHAMVSSVHAHTKGMRVYTVDETYTWLLVKPAALILEVCVHILAVCACMLGLVDTVLCP